MGLAYANAPFSLLAKVLSKITYEGGRVVMCTPDWGCSGEHAYWRRMLDRMIVGRVQLPDGPIYVLEDLDTAMQAPEWASFLSIVHRSLSRRRNATDWIIRGGSSSRSRRTPDWIIRGQGVA